MIQETHKAVGIDDLDQVHSEYQDATNMGDHALKQWSESDCLNDYVSAQSDQGDARAAIRRNRRLKSKPKDEWTTDDVRDAQRAVDFIARHMGQSDSENEVPGDNCNDLTMNAAALLSWARDINGRYSSKEAAIPDESWFCVERAETTKAAVSVHDVSFDDTGESESWSSLAMEDFDTDDLSEIDNHFFASKSGFPPENFSDLNLEVVRPDGTLDLQGLRSAWKVAASVDGITDEQAETVKSKINRLGEEQFGHPFDDSDSDDENMTMASSAETDKAEHDSQTISHGTIVSWGNGDATAWGKVRELYPSGEAVPASAIAGDSGVSLEDEDAAVIAVYQDNDEGDYEPKDGDQGGEERVAHALDTLTPQDEFGESKAAALHRQGYQHREKSVQFRAADPNRQVVYGAVLLPNSLDAHGDFFREETVRSLSEGFMASMADADAEPTGNVPGLESAGAGGVMHATFEPSHLTLVENTILTESREVGTGPAARQFPAGTWLQGWRIEDSELWSLVHDSGVLSGYSIGMWVSETDTYAPGELPDDVRIPDTIREQFADLDVDVEDMETGEIISGDCHEVSLVDRPAVPDAVHVAHKTASDTGWQTDAEAFEQSRDDQPSYALAKAAGALTQSYDSCVAYLRDRGHSEDAADELASYLQRVSGFDSEAGQAAESAWTRIKSIFGGSHSDLADTDDAPDTNEIPVPLSVGTDTASAHTAPITAEIPLENDPEEKVGRTLSERNERSAMALHDLSLLLLRDADRDGGRMLFAEDPEYSYDTDLTDVLSGDSDSEPKSDSDSTSTDETEQLMDELFHQRENSPSGTSGSGGASGSDESASVAD
jgi:hypothetical protein